MVTQDHKNIQESMVHAHRDVQGGSARAAVFGVSDGLVSNAALILGVAAADIAGSTVLLTGISGMLAGGISMAAGEYVSMKAQKELIEREIAIEKQSLLENPQKEISELKAIYMGRGLLHQEAQLLAEAIHRDPEIALEVHTREELGINLENIGNPVTAALASFGAFTFGAVIPLVPWTFFDGNQAIALSLLLALLTASFVGILLSYFTEKSKFKTAVRQTGWAAAACLLTFVIGKIFQDGL